MTESRPERPFVSVVIPCRNEEENAPLIAVAVTEQLRCAGVDHEIVFIDNDSEDRTVEVIRVMCAADHRIKLIVNTRNFGQMRSPAHAIFATRGDAVIGMCADFQDSPELLPTFVEKWRDGADIVLGVREAGRTTFLLGSLRRLFYWVSARVGEYAIIPNATGFGLYDRKVVEAMRVLREPEPFVRGMLVETGYRTAIITYPRPGRLRGISKNNFLTLLDFALSGLAASAKNLIRLPFFLAAICFMSTLLCSGVALVAGLTGGAWVSWLIAAGIELQLGLVFGVLGLIGDQVRLTAERTRGTPLVFERERVNFDATA